LCTAPINFQGTLFTDSVRAVEDPVLPRGQAPEDAREHGLGPGEAQARLHRGERVGREARTLLDRESDLFFPVDVVRRSGDEAELERFLGVEELAACKLRLLAAEAGGEAREAIGHGVDAEAEGG